MLRGVRPGAAEVTDRFTGEAREIKADVVIDAGYRLPDETLWQQRPDAGPGR